MATNPMYSSSPRRLQSTVWTQDFPDQSRIRAGNFGLAPGHGQRTSLWRAASHADASAHGHHETSPIRHRASWAWWTAAARRPADLGMDYCLVLIRANACRSGSRGNKTKFLRGRTGSGKVPFATRLLMVLLLQPPKARLTSRHATNIGRSGILGHSERASFMGLSRKAKRPVAFRPQALF